MRDEIALRKSRLQARRARLSAEKQALLERQLRGEAVETVEVEVIPRRRDPGPAPLSFAQQRLWFIDQWEPGSPTYNLPTAVRLSGPLDVRALAWGLNEIVRRHEALRTTFVAQDGHPMQVVAPALTLLLPLIDLQGLPEKKREAKMHQLALEEAQRPFDLVRGPLVRASVLRLEKARAGEQGQGEGHVLLVTMHHIVSDGWSAGVFIHELVTLYQAFLSGASSRQAGRKQPRQAEPRLSPLLELPIQYADFAVWQREWLQGEVLEKQLAYWTEQLAASAVLEFPTDRPRPPLQSFRGAKRSFLLPAALSQALQSLSRQEGVTLFMTLLAAFKVLLYRYTGQKDISVGSPIANRNRVEVERLIGFFVNTLVLRTDLAGNPSFCELLERVRKVTLGAFAHQDLPFEMLVEHLQPQRDLSRSPLFQVMFVLQNAPTPVQGRSGLTFSVLDVDNEAAHFDLILIVEQEGQTLRGEFEYSTDLFDDSTIARLARHFQTLLEGIVANPGQSLSTLPLLEKAERGQLLQQWSHTGIDYARDLCVHDLFRQQVSRVPAKVSLVGKQGRLTFRWLDEQTNQLAHLLGSLVEGRGGLEARQVVGQGPQERMIGLLLDPGPHVAIGMLGILKSGCGFVPIDPQYPHERIDFMLTDCGIETLVTEARCVDLARRLAKKNPGLKHIVCLDSVQKSPGSDDGFEVYDCRDYARGGLREQAVHVGREQLVYVVYTSGSTGRPKGVPITHENLVPMLLWGRDYLGLGEHTRTLQSLSFCFDFGIFEVLTTVLFGGTVYFLDRAEWADAASYARYVNEQGINTINTTPSFFRMLAAVGVKLETLELLHLGGEELTNRTLDEIFATVGEQCVVYNGYGPTEATINSAIFTVGRRSSRRYETSNSVPIGKVSANNRLYVLDEDGQLVPVGVPGELHVGGVGLARGYLNRSALTAQRFIPDPFSDGVGGRLYRTGDLVRCLPDGNIEFLGRLDYQVKIRGYRVELGEIEATLAEHPEVQEAVVVARGDRPDEKHLVAYVVSADDVGELRSYLKDRLPEYMVPSAFVTLEALPLTPNGKVDRRALPEPAQVRLEKKFVPPRTPTEKSLAQIWAEMLGVEQIGVYDNFFELGGHSLLATRVVSRVREVLQADLPLPSLFEKSTLEGFAQVIDTFLEKEPSAGTVAITAEDFEEGEL